MEFYLILKIIFVIAVLIALYAIFRNLDIIKIILIYFKDKLLGK
jgi:ABC-type maltose transport system permease subunit